MNYLNNFKPRLYQETIFAKALTKNTLVVLPTGLGKTAIAMMLTIARLNQNKNSKAIILAPTRPLVNQHYESFKEKINPDFIHEDDMIVFNGQIKPEKRQELFKDARIIFSTPQGLENDLLTKRITLEEVSLIVFDEAHRATGDYSYVWVADQYRKQANHEKILALTASPGADKEVIDLVTKNLHVEAIEFKDKDSPDVKPYVKETKFTWIEVILPKEFQEILKYLNNIYKNKLSLVETTLGKINKSNLSKRDLLKLQAKLQAQIALDTANPETYQAISILAQIMKIQHGIELLETQGVSSATKYMDEIWKQGNAKKTKAAITLCQDLDFKNAITGLWKLKDNKLEHPKIPKLLEILDKTLTKNPDAKIIVFNNYRESIKNLHKLIKINLPQPFARPAIFVGQSKKGGIGITQKKQLELIKEFKDGTHNIMLMSSVGEEGLDIPAVDLVLFYEPVPSAIRQIQRAGRTGRQEKGDVKILMAKGTRDVAYRWSTQSKQRKMYEILEQTKSELNLNQNKKQKTLIETFEEKAIEIKDIGTQKTDPFSNEEEAKITTQNPKVIVDTREKSNRIIKQLINNNIDIELKQLKVGDYILTQDTAIEFKTQEDFINSIVDGRMLSQASTLSRNYTKPIIIVQGERNLYGIRNINPSAIAGVISSLAIDFKIPIIFTKNEQETMNIFLSIIKKQNKIPKDISEHHIKPKESHKIQEYIISSLPNIGPSQAKSLLTEFKTIKQIITASEEELKQVDKIGKLKAKQINEIISKKYKP